MVLLLCYHLSSRIELLPICDQNIILVLSLKDKVKDSRRLVKDPLGSQAADEIKIKGASCTTNIKTCAFYYSVNIKHVTNIKLTNRFFHQLNCSSKASNSRHRLKLALKNWSWCSLISPFLNRTSKKLQF